MKKHIGMGLIVGGLLLNATDEVTGSGTGVGKIYGTGAPLAAVYQALPIDPGLIMIAVGVVLVFVG